MPRKTRNDASKPNAGINHGAESRLLQLAGLGSRARKQRRREMEFELQIALERRFQPLLELAVGEKPRDFVFVLVGHQLEQISAPPRSPSPARPGALRRSASATLVDERR